jgi:hypothetical protein
MVGLTQLGVTWGCDKDANKVPPDRASDAKRLSVTQISKSEQLLTQLARTIEGEIIPRLMLTHRVSVETFFDPVQEGETFLLSENVADFVDLSLKYDVDAAASYIAALRAQGTPLEAVYLDLLTPTARRLGDMWVEDLCDFTQVTVGLCCLQQLLHELSADFHSESAKEYQAQGRRALLLPVPGEQHTFGLCHTRERAVLHSRGARLRGFRT